jgi:hypothetical protein
MHFRARRLPPWLLLIPTLILLLLAAGGYAISRGRPRLTDTFPAPGAPAVPALAPIRLTFDKPMNRGSVQAALTTDPPRTGNFTWDANTLTFTPTQPWAGGTIVTITLGADARGAAGIRLAAPITWSFRTAPTLLAYLWPADAPANLYALDPLSGDTLQLTHTQRGILDFSPAPDRLTILLSLANPAGGADLATLNLLDHSLTILHRCHASLCLTPQYNPAASLIAYEDQTAGTILLLEPGGSPQPVAPGRFPAWSARGLLLAYDPALPGYFTFDPATGSRTDFPNQTGEPASWDPASPNHFLAPEISLAPLFGSHLTRHTLLPTLTTDLTLDPSADDYAPAFSPDGATIAFARRFLDATRWTPGRQLWLMHADGTNPRPLTDAPLYSHLAFAWHPGGAQIAFVRSNQADLNEPPELWIINADGSNPLRLVINAYAPQWLP